MKEIKVSVRELLRDFGESTKSLPIVITRWGIPILKVFRYEKDIKSNHKARSGN